MTSLGDIIQKALEQLLLRLFKPVLDFVEKNADGVLKLIVSTPHPDAVFTKPTNGAWPAIYSYYWDSIVPIALLLWASSLGLVILLESTSHLFSSYHRTKLKKRAFAGLLGILSWWWLAALSLRLVEGLTGILLPDLSSISLFDVASFGGMGVLGTIVAATVDLSLFLIIAVLYYMRQVVLYLFVLLMPILLSVWVMGVGPFALAAKLMKRLAGFYVPFLFMTVPVALLFQVGKLLGRTAEPSLGGLGQWLVAIVTPLVAVVAPFVLFWQAGALFFMAERASHHASLGRARSRLNRARSAADSARHGGRNFARGLRGEPAVRTDGQTVLSSGNSRAHATGHRLAQSGTALRDTLASATDGGSAQASQTVTESRPAGQADDRTPRQRRIDRSRRDPDPLADLSRRDDTTEPTDNRSDSTDDV